MNHRCPVCGGKMNRWRFPVLKRHDQFGRPVVIYKCIECGHEETYPDV